MNTKGLRQSGKLNNIASMLLNLRILKVRHNKLFVQINKMHLVSFWSYLINIEIKKIL